MTSQREIRRWLREGKADGATHTLIVCDTFDHSDYPRHIKVTSEEAARAAAQNNGAMQRLMEVYSHALDHESQLAEHRSYHYEMTGPAPVAPPTPAPKKTRKAPPTPKLTPKRTGLAKLKKAGLTQAEKKALGLKG